MGWLDGLGQSRKRLTLAGNEATHTLTFTASQRCYSKGVPFQLPGGFMKYFSS